MWKLVYDWMKSKCWYGLGHPAGGWKQIKGHEVFFFGGGFALVGIEKCVRCGRTRGNPDLRPLYPKEEKPDWHPQAPPKPKWDSSWRL